MAYDEMLGGCFDDFPKTAKSIWNDEGIAGSESLHLIRF